MTQNNKHAVSLNPPKTHVSTAEIEARDLNCVEQCKSRLNLPKVSVMILAAAAFMAAICNENSACSCPAATVSTWAEPASNGKTNATLNWGDEMGRLAKVMKTYMIRSKVGHGLFYGLLTIAADGSALWGSFSTLSITLCWQVERKGKKQNHRTTLRWNTTLFKSKWPLV